MAMSVFKGAKVVALTLLCAGVAGCGLPRSGPNKAEIFKGSVLKDGDAFIVQVNSRVTQATSVTPSFGFSNSFMNAGVIGSDMIAAGDKLSLTVYENVKDDPLLGNSGQRLSQLNELQVDGQGFIFIPYAGRIKASGKSPEELRNEIAGKLDAQTPDPQVIVQRVAGDGSTTPGRIYGVLVRPYPTQQMSGGPSAAIGASAPPTGGVGDVLRSGFIMAKLPPGASVVADGTVYVWAAATSGNNIQGKLVAAANSTNTYTVTNARFVGPADADGNVEIEVWSA